MQVTTRYIPTYEGSQFVTPCNYIIINKQEYKLNDVIDMLHKANKIDTNIYNKLKHKNASIKTILYTIKDLLHLIG